MVWCSVHLSNQATLTTIHAIPESRERSCWHASDKGCQGGVYLEFQGQHGFKEA